MAARRLRPVVCVVVWLASAGVPAGAQVAPEPALRAAFIHNFAKFTDWPRGTPPAGAPFLICTTEPPVAAALASLVDGSRIERQPVRALHVAPASPVRDCAVLHIGPVPERQQSALLAAVQGTSILTVGDRSDFLDRGGIIHLFVEDQRMRFAISARAALAAQLRLSAQLLQLAAVVR